MIQHFRSEEHTSELQSHSDLVCRLLLEKKSELEDRMKNKGMKVDSFAYHLNVFDYGVPPHAGCGIGLERLMMALTGTENIRDTTFYPRDVDRLTP